MEGSKRIDIDWSDIRGNTSDKLVTFQGIMSLFSEEMRGYYETSALFNAIVHYLMFGASPYHVIEMLIKQHKEHTDLIQKLSEKAAPPTVTITCNNQTCPFKPS